MPLSGINVKISAYFVEESIIAFCFCNHQINGYSRKIAYFMIHHSESLNFLNTPRPFWMGGACKVGSESDVLEIVIRFRCFSLSALDHSVATILSAPRSVVLFRRLSHVNYVKVSCQCSDVCTTWHRDGNPPMSIGARSRMFTLPWPAAA